MKTSLIIFCFTLMSVSAFGKVTISGKIIGYDGKSTVAYYPTIDGIHAPYTVKVKPTADGSFRIEYENKGFGTARVSYKGVIFRFFTDTNSKMYFEIRDGYKLNNEIPQKRIFNHIDSLKRAHTIKITGDYSDINNFYNRQVRTSYSTTRLKLGDYYSLILYKTSNPLSALAKLDSLIQIEVDQIEKLPIATQDFLTTEVYSFYGAEFLNALRLKRVEQVAVLNKDSTASRSVYNRDWETMYESLREEAKKLAVLTSSPDYSEFMEMLADDHGDYQQYKNSSISTSTLDNWVELRLLNYDTTLLKDEKIRFQYELSGLNSFLESEFYYSRVLLNAINVILEKRAGSKHLEYFQPKLDVLRKYLEKASVNNANNSKIIKSNNKDFNSLIKRFEGKNVFIDIWATWCGPCIKEFKYRSVLQPFVKKGDIEVLYISIDKPQFEDRWRQSIVVNELEGNHFRGDQPFVEDMWNAIGDPKGEIPRYVLIDKQGRIFKSTASKPSEGDQLAKEIQLLISVH